MKLTKASYWHGRHSTLIKIVGWFRRWERDVTNSTEQNLPFLSSIWWHCHCLDHIASGGKVAAQVKRIWKKLSQPDRRTIVAGRNRGKPCKTLVIIAGVAARIPTENLPNKVERYRYTNQLGKALLEKLIVSYLDWKFPNFCGTRRCFTVFTGTRSDPNGSSPHPHPVPLRQWFLTFAAACTPFFLRIWSPTPHQK
jgi:hypothetical protein